MGRKCDPYESLMWGIIENNEEAVEKAMTEGGNINQSSPTGSRPLHAAALIGSPSIIKLLLKRGASVDQVDDDGFTPLMVAALNGKSKSVKVLLDKNADLHKTVNNGETVLHLATNTCSPGVVSALLDHGAIINAQTTDCLSTPLHYAARFNNLPVTKILLRHAGCDAKIKNDKKQTAYDVAMKHGYNRLAHHLDMPDLNNKQNKALIEAVLRGKEDAARNALEGGADVNVSSLTGSRPLHAAALKGLVPVVTLLLEHKAWVDQEDDEGYTPLMVAALNGHGDVVNKILAYRAAPNRSNNNGEMALHLATTSTNPSVVTALLHNGADINAQTKECLSTPLHYAACSNNITVAKILLNDARCNKYTKDYKDQVPAEVALKHGYKDMATLLGYISDEKDATQLQTPWHPQAEEVGTGPHVVRGKPVSPDEDVYKCLSHPRGHVIVFNYAYFNDRLSYRGGAHRDNLNLNYVFKKMGYKVFIHQDLDQEKTEEELDHFCNNKYLENVDVAVVCILSHGKDRETFFTSDGDEMTVNQVYSRLARCPALKGKPKLFLFNFCRGDFYEAGTSLVGVTTDSKKLGIARMEEQPVKPTHLTGEVKGSTVRPLDDAFTIFASMEGVMAYQHPREGTLFIQCLTETLAQYSHSQDVAEMARRLSNHMRDIMATMPDRQNLLRKKFYLNPTSS